MNLLRFARCFLPYFCWVFCVCVLPLAAGYYLAKFRAAPAVVEITIPLAAAPGNGDLQASLDKLNRPWTPPQTKFVEEPPPCHPEAALSPSVKIDVYPGCSPGRGLAHGGTAVHVGNGLFLTTRYIGHAKGCPVILVWGGTKYVGSVVALARFTELAAIYCPQASDIPIATLALDRPAAGERVQAVGYPAINGRRQRTIAGEMNTAVSSISEGGHFYSNEIMRMRCNSGDGGAPILNVQNQLVGVLWGGSSDSTMASTWIDTVKFLTEDCSPWFTRQMPVAD